MRTITAILAPGILLLGTIAALAGADTEPVIVVPGRPGIPVIINGQDVSGAVIEGDWGLGHSQIGLTIIQRRIYPGRGVAGLYAPAPNYFPRTGRPPRLGRLEILPPADGRLPKPAQSYEHRWEASSAALPATSNLFYPPPCRRGRRCQNPAEPE